jgi:pimeloyl-ACP methyl ester carboxylesterase
MDELDPGAFEVRRANVGGVDLAYLREGAGGFPLLLLHGWPETMRIWWRNIRPLADAGFEVIVPDLRGFGLSGQPPDGFHDVVAQARDVEALVRGELGHDRVVTCGGDLGGVIAQELALRFEGFVPRQVLFNTVMPPLLRDEYAAAGVPGPLEPLGRMASDYFIRQANDADGLAAELDSPEKRRRYVGGMYGHRFWATPGGFSQEAVEFMVEPFADADAFRGSIAIYESARGTRPVSERPLFADAHQDTPTLVLYGPDDHVIAAAFTRQAEVVFSELVGPFVVEGAGHFLQWERAHVLNRAIKYFCLDLLGNSAANGC